MTRKAATQLTKGIRSDSQLPAKKAKPEKEKVPCKPLEIPVFSGVGRD